MARNRLQTFPCFRGLPRELRDCIWDLSIQNFRAEPEVHFFLVDKDMHTVRTEYIQQRTAVGRWTSTTPVKSPMGKTRASNHLAWVRYKNSSGYLLDSGLWCACVESREAIAQRTKRAKCPYGDITILKIPAGDSWQRCIAMRLQQDLVIFQIPDMTSVKHGILKHLVGHCSLWGNKSVKNFGIVFDTTWAWILNRGYRYHDPVGSLLKEVYWLAKSRPDGSELWLIDHHTLQPMQGMEYADLVKDRRVFRGNGRQYVEVRRQDVRDRWSLAKGISYFDSTVVFALNMEMEVMDYMDFKDHHEDTDPAHGVGLSWKVAAWFHNN